MSKVLSSKCKACCKGRCILNKLATIHWHSQYLKSIYRKMNYELIFQLLKLKCFLHAQHYHIPELVDKQNQTCYIYRLKACLCIFNCYSNFCHLIIFLKLYSFHWSLCVHVQPMQWVSFSISEIVLDYILVRILNDSIDPWDHEVWAWAEEVFILKRFNYRLAIEC